MLALVATGAGVVAASAAIQLWLGYVPSSPGADVPTGAAATSRDLRDLYATAWLVLALAAVAWWAVAFVTSPASRRVLAAGALLAGVGGALVWWTAPRLVWDQAALWTVSVGTDSLGDTVDPPTEGLLLGDQVRFYLVDDREVTPGELEALVAAHALGATFVAVGLAGSGSLARARRRRPDEHAASAPQR